MAALGQPIVVVPRAHPAASGSSVRNIEITSTVPQRTRCLSLEASVQAKPRLKPLAVHGTYLPVKAPGVTNMAMESVVTPKHTSSLQSKHSGLFQTPKASKKK
jgi:hypothetical protein